MKEVIQSKNVVNSLQCESYVDCDLAQFFRERLPASA